MYLSVLKVYTLCNALHILCSHRTVKEYVIYLLLKVLRMSQLTCQVTIVSEEQHTRCVTVQTTYRVYALRTYVLYEVHNSLALLWVVACGYIVLWFVKKYVNLLLQRHILVAETYLIGAEHLCSQFLNDLSVNGYCSCEYEVVSLATAAHTCISEILIKTDGLIRIEILLLIFYTLFQAVLCIRIIVIGTWTIVLAWTLSVAGMSVVVLAVVVLTVAVLTVWTLLIASSTIILAWLVAVTLTRTIASVVVVLTWLVAVVLTRTVSTCVIVLTWLVGALWTLLRVQCCTESFWSEPSFVVIDTWTVRSATIYTWTWRTTCWTIVLVSIRTITLTAILIVLFCRKTFCLLL